MSKILSLFMHIRTMDAIGLYANQYTILMRNKNANAYVKM